MLIKLVMKNKKGFTLVELLVVVAIIGILAAVSVVALNTARARARDSRRVADVRQMQTALELYYNDEGTYPASAAPGGQIKASTSGTVYMSQIPTPPSPHDGNCTAANNLYLYAIQGSGTTNPSYTITYCLGSATGGLDAGVSVATPATIQQ
ncbi:prepilin-type N-terminal cleavage/methylation domain-containing protein [Candidatus Falkowbacteria bacterium]|nr:prepilin-type N-terminal cleavage/methylation domain-containing protein [Candidatus Falkowbacteria bacterium]